MSNQLAPHPRILFINRSYWPDVEATGQLLTELCESLAADFDITVICGRPQKVVDDVPPESVRLTERNGIRIQRVHHTQFNKASFVGRIVNMLTFQAAATWCAVTRPRADVVVVETDPPFLCVLGRILQVARRSQLVCYLQDIYPDVAVALGKLRPGMIARLLRWAFFRIYRHSDAVVILSRDMRDLLEEGGVAPQRLHVIPNWIDTDVVQPLKSANRFRIEHNLTDKFVVMYSGNLGMSQNLGQALETAELLRDRPEIAFVFVGDGVDRGRLESIARQKNLANVKFVNYQPKANLASSLSAADVHLVVLQPHIQQLLMPSKLYGALASGTPVLAITSDDCELAEIVRLHDLGRVVPGQTADELAEAIATMANEPERLAVQAFSAREFAETQCTRDSSVARMTELFSNLLNLGSEPASDPVSTEVAVSIR